MLASLIDAGKKRSIFFGTIILIASCALNSDVFIVIDEAAEFPGFEYQGEYTGQLILVGDEDEQDVSLQVAVYGENRFRALLILDNLPGESERTITEEQMIELTGGFHDNTVVLEGDYPLRFQFSRERFTALDEQSNERGHLDRIVRESPSMGLRPPEDAIMLFDGSNLNHWDENTRMTEDGLLMQGARTANNYGDIRLHLEAKVGFMPNSSSQGRANRGIYIQNRYEVQDHTGPVRFRNVWLVEGEVNPPGVYILEP